MRFEIQINSKRLLFGSDLHGLRINGVDYLSGRDGILIYDKTRDLTADVVELQMSTNTQALPLPEELLTRMTEPSTLLGFYEGFPIFDGSTGFARLQSRLGIHIDTETIMISTPLDKYEADVYEIAEKLEKETGLEPSKKKNRVMFLKDEKLLKALGM